MGKGLVFAVPPLSASVFQPSPHAVPEGPPGVALREAFGDCGRRGGGEGFVLCVRRRSLLPMGVSGGSQMSLPAIS